MKRTETLRGIVAVCLVVVSASCVHKSGYRNRHSRANERTVNRVESRDDRVTEHTRIRMVKENGVYYVPIEVNGLNLRFIFDTGASSILLSSAEAMVMYRQGLISCDVILRSSQMQDASGGISTGVVVNLRAVKIGDIMLHNVQATVVDNIQAPLLLGQTALSKFGKVSLDYNHGYIEFN